MLRRIGLPYLFVLAAIVTMVLAAGGVWQFARPVDEMLRALVPTWIGIAAVFWVLWRQIPPANTADTPTRPVPRRRTVDFAPLRLERRYADISQLPLDTLEYVVLDTETTGPDGDRDDIVQIGAVRIIGGKIVSGDSFSRLVNPGRPIPPASTHFHGVTDDMVTDAPAIGAVLADFRDYVGDAVLVGHNLATDITFLNRVAGFDNPTLDTMLLSVGTFESRSDHTLDAVAEHFEEPVNERHTAPGDAELTARIFLRLLPELDRIGARRFGDAQDLCAHSADRIDDADSGR